ncbi:MAG: hypothetical protein HWE39_13055 [Oceanospirillaceae bacterium]|nr:hypothetical protein [Oceanospirillaceae bacterium]
MSNTQEQDQQHRNWMDVTGTAMHQVHSASGYKGAARRPLIRPLQLPPEEKAPAKKKG